MAQIFILCRKNFDYADTDVGKLCRSVSPHPVMCPVKRGKDISRVIIFFCLQMDAYGNKLVHLFGNLWAWDAGHPDRWITVQCICIYLNDLDIYSIILMRKVCTQCATKKCLIKSRPLEQIFWKKQKNKEWLSCRSSMHNRSDVTLHYVTHY